MKLTTKAFDETVQQAIAGIPDEINRHLENIVISVQRRPTREMLRQLNFPPDEEPLGLYMGNSLMERSVFAPVNYPDTIYIFQEPLEEMCQTQEELEEQIRITVVHEIAHYLGMSDDRLDELGYG
ncbi:MAG: hypothetical protein CSYNP_02720 [Syntrophus sp. SKADARSKE-3]|nr:hypothetical protein [Syntrophus sp. SKADARSKE-3]